MSRRKLALPARGAPPRSPEGEARRVASVRMHLLEAHPFWGYLLMQLRVVPWPELPAIAATDCVRHIWYNPAYTCNLDLAQLGFVLAHEVGHSVFATLGREAGRDRRRWNRATDYAINRNIAAIPDPAVLYPAQALYRPPDGTIPGLGEVRILLDERFAGDIAEVIYERIERDDDAGAQAAAIVDIDLGEVGVHRGIADHGGGIDVHLPDSLTPEQREALADRLRAAVAHHRASESRGLLPGEVERALFAERSRVPWTRLLRRFVSEARSRTEYDTRRPQARWLDEGFVVPSWGGESPGLIVVALDTSGSMSDSQLAELAGEIRALAGATDELLLLVADAKVQEAVESDGIEEWLRRGRAKGGGGTNHVPVFEYIARSGRKPDLFIGLTDLESQFPARPPTYPVVWVTPERHGKAPFGAVVEVR